MSDQEVTRVLLHHIDAGDRRKFDAESNDSETGGGARDLRFRPEDRFLPFFGRLFPGRRVEPRTRNGARVDIEVFFGPVNWTTGPDAERGRVAQMEVWPATPSRPGECRIARVHEFGFTPLVIDDPAGGKSVLMLVQTSDGGVSAWFTTETVLRQGDWDPVIQRFAESWLESGTKAGFIDLVSGEQYPDA